METKLKNAFTKTSRFSKIIKGYEKIQLFFTNKKTIELVLNSDILAIFVWLAYQAYYELFVENYARVTIRTSEFGTKVVEFSLDVPTVTNFILLFVASLCICSTIMIYSIHTFSLNKKTKIYWIIQIIGFFICLFTALFYITDFNAPVGQR